MQKWACGVSYLGSGYHGWQKQPGLSATIEQTLADALSAVADEPIALVCAGRTDRGVHATGQVVHFVSSKQRLADNWRLGANRLLPASIKLQWVVPVDDGFHARYSACSRRYCYVTYHAPASHPLLSDRVVWMSQDLQSRCDLMQQAANVLIGEHDFSSFRDQD